MRENKKLDISLYICYNTLYNGHKGNPMHNWRLLETELIDIARREGFEIDEDYYGDKFIPNTQGFDLNLTHLAVMLTLRGVEAKGHAVSVLRD